MRDACDTFKSEDTTDMKPVVFKCDFAFLPNLVNLRSCLNGLKRRSRRFPTQLSSKNLRLLLAGCLAEPLQEQGLLDRPPTRPSLLPCTARELNGFALVGNNRSCLAFSSFPNQTFVEHRNSGRRDTRVPFGKMGGSFRGASNQTSVRSSC